MGNYTGARKTHPTTREYLEFLDERLGFPHGTLCDLCVAAVKTKVEVKEGTTVTYRGMYMRQKRLTNHKIIQVRKTVFLIEFMMTKAGKQYNRVVQIHLEL
jgi:uncharacterized protein Veg